MTAAGVQKAWRETGRHGRVWGRCPQEDVHLALPGCVGKRMGRFSDRDRKLKPIKNEAIITLPHPPRKQ